MKKGFKIGCLGIIVLAAIGIIGATLERWYNGPTQSIMFLNTGNSLKSVTFERIEKDGKLSDAYVINTDIKPNQILIEKIPAGNYNVKVWNQDESLYQSTDFKIVLKDPKKSDYQLYRLDLAMDKIYAIVNLNALYEGNSFAEHMSNAAGTNRDKLRIEKLYNGGVPFLVLETYTSRTFVDMEDKIPTKVKYGEIVYGLFAFPKTLPEDQVQATLFEQVFEKLK